jgi:hypothetical protein
MAKQGFEASGRMSVEKFEQLFRGEFDVYCDILDEKGRIAKQSASLASLRPKDFKAPGKVDFSLSANMQVANVQKKFRENFGLELQIYKLNKPDEKDTLASLRKGVLLGDDDVGDDYDEGEENTDNEFDIESFSEYELKAAEVLFGSDGKNGLLTILYRIYDENIPSIQEGDYKVRPGYAYDKFYLNRLSDYDMGLLGLIHHIMYKEGFYSKILSEKRLKEVKKVVENDPESIYRPPFEGETAEEDIEFEIINTTLDVIYSNACKFVGISLNEEGCDISEFVEEYGECSSLINNFFDEAERCSTEEEIKDMWVSCKSDLENDFDVYDLNLIKAGIVNMLKGI